MLAPLAPAGLGPLAQSQSAFTPASIANMRVWFADASALFQNSGGTTPATTNGDPVGFDTDQSPSAYNVIQATSGLRPVLKSSAQNGRRGLTFSNKYMVGSGVLTHGIGTGNFWWINVCKPTTVSVSYQLMSGFTGGFSGGCYIDQNKLNFFFSGDHRGAISLSANTCYLLEIWRSGTTLALAVNAVADSTFTLSSSIANQGLGLGADSAAPADPLSGDLMETILYASYNSAQQVSLRTYLNNKWAIY